MFDIGFWELLMVGIIALIVLGPERLPHAARTLGLWVGKAKRGFNAVKNEIDRELKLQELEQQVAEQKQKLEEAVPLEDLKQDLTGSLQQTTSSIQSVSAEISESLETSSATKASTDSPPTEKSTPNDKA